MTGPELCCAGRSGYATPGRADRHARSRRHPRRSRHPRSREGSSMPPRVFDWHDDPTGTFLAAPQIRARFTRYQPGAGYQSYQLVLHERPEEWDITRETPGHTFDADM